MTQVFAKRQVRSSAVRAMRAAGVASLVAGIAVYAGYRADRAVLHEIATGIVEGVVSPTEKVLAVNTWVHWHNGFVANAQSYGIARLGATPLQVVDDGGDCADKSRLVVALLAEIDIPATSAMCFDPATGNAVHTVVEAHLGGDHYVVVDPSFDLFFPKDEPGKFYGLVDMRRDPTILPARLNEITSARNFWMRVNGYHQDRSVYDLASTFNWNKNFATRAIFASLIPSMGEDVYRIRRPRVLEEPKLAIASVAMFAGIGMLTGSVFLRRNATRKKNRSTALVASASRSVVQPLIRSRNLTRGARNRKVLESV